ncbi:MAG: glycosyltransferase [Candidatus Parcubacteria bacterium]|nr:glycosyltransferase [Candidatus Parcubacteria bacterium]
MINKIKIVYIISSFALGGAERLLLDLCRKLDKEKFEIYICSVTGGGPLLGEFEKLDVKVKVFQKKTKLGLGVIWQIFKYLKSIKPQIVHTHLFGGDTWGRIAAIWARVLIIIVTEHNMNLDESWLKKKIKLILSWFTDKIIAVSQGVKEYTIKIEKIKPAKIEVIYNGIDLEKFAWRGFKPIGFANIKALVVARLHEQKGHKYLLEAMPLICEKYPNFILNIVGTGNLLKNLKEQAANLGIINKVVFWEQQLEIEKILPQMDLFILPSIWEGLGIAIIEAQAVGVPVLASNIGGLKELIEHKKTGLLFEPKNPQAILKTVDLLLSNPDLVKQMVENAHNQVKEKFSLEQMVKSYTDLYLNSVKNINNS